MMIDKQTEYGALRQEILDSINARDNYIVGMYTITIAILCVAFELQNPILFLMPYIVIYAFQYWISVKSENMIVIGAYIAVYLEDGSGWEYNNAKLKKIMHKDIPYKRVDSVWKFLVGRIGSVQLGMLCSVSCIGYAVSAIMKASSQRDLIAPGIYIALSLILYILIRIQTRNVLKTGERKKAYEANLRAAKETEEEKELVSA